MNKFELLRNSNNRLPSYPKLVFRLTDIVVQKWNFHSGLGQPRLVHACQWTITSYRQWIYYHNRCKLPVLPVCPLILSKLFFKFLPFLLNFFILPHFCYLFFLRVSKLLLSFSIPTVYTHFSSIRFTVRFCQLCVYLLASYTKVNLFQNYYNPQQFKCKHCLIWLLYFK